jgi:membrane-associated phospholipid phosphatase
VECNINIIVHYFCSFSMTICLFFSRRRLSLCLCAFLLCTSLTAVAKSPVEADSTRSASQRDVGAIILSDAGIALADAGTYFTAPLRFSSTDWLIAAGTLGASAALMPADESLNMLMLRNRSQTADVFAEAGRFYGELAVGGGIGAGLYVIGLASQNEDVRVTGRLTLEALAYGGVVNIALKSLTGRSRPYTEQGAFKFQPVQFNTDNTAFPSGHATVAFAVSAVLAERIGNPWVGAGLYAMASLTALSRMYQTKHWASDVLLGSAIGAGAGLLVTHLERERAKKVSAGEQLFIYPTLTGIGLTYNFR